MSKGVLSVAAWYGTKIAASALSAPILARLLSTSGYGEYAYYVAVMMVAWPLANVGTLPTLAKYVAEQPDDVGRRSALSLFTGVVNLASTLTVASLVALLIAPGGRMEVGARLVVVAVVGSIVLEQAGYFGCGILYGVHREELASLPGGVGAMLGPFVGVALAWLGLGLAGALLGVLAANLVVAVGTLRYAGRYVEWRAARSTLAHLPRSGVMRFGLSSMLHATLVLVLYRADIVLIRNLSTDTQTGLYAAATQWSGFVAFLPLAVQAMMLQSTSPLWTAGRPDAITEMLSRLVRYVAMATGLPLLIVFVFADPILALYFGPDFAAASPALRILVPGMFGYFLARVMWPVLQASGHTTALVIVMAAATGGNLILNVLLIPAWGSVGAAAASCVSYGSVVFVYARILEGLGVRPFRGLRADRLAVLCVATLVAALPAVLWVSSRPLSVLVGALAATIVYGGGALRLGLIRWTEILEIAASLPGPVREPVARWLRALQPLANRLEGRSQPNTPRPP